jgi:tetratricopeptide (TPR) repeat protein
MMDRNTPLTRSSAAALAIFLGSAAFVSLPIEVRATEGSGRDSSGMSSGQDDRWKSSASIGFAALEGGRYDVAIRYLTAALEGGAINEAAAYLHELRGDAYLGKGDSAKAAADYRRAVAFVPKNTAEYLMRGKTYEKMGNYKAAASDFAKGLAHSPDDRQASNSLAWLLATCPDGSVRDGRAAIRIGTKACELSGWKDSELIDTLAAAYAETGSFDRAVKLEQQALLLRSISPDTLQGMQERLVSYQKRKPYREPRPRAH